jgi:hypothetical protein
MPTKVRRWKGLNPVVKTIADHDYGVYASQESNVAWERYRYSGDAKQVVKCAAVIIPSFMKENRLGDPTSPTFGFKVDSPEDQAKNEARSALGSWLTATDRLSEHYAGSLIDELRDITGYLCELAIERGLVIDKSNGYWNVRKKE